MNTLVLLAAARFPRRQHRAWNSLGAFAIAIGAFLPITGAARAVALDTKPSCVSTADQTRSCAAGVARTSQTKGPKWHRAETAATRAPTPSPALTQPRRDRYERDLWRHQGVG
jgi:hypothetical protein